MGDLQRRFLGIVFLEGHKHFTIDPQNVSRFYATLFCKARHLPGSHTFLQGQKHFLVPKWNEEPIK